MYSCILLQEYKFYSSQPPKSANIQKWAYFHKILILQLKLHNDK